MPAASDPMLQRVAAVRYRDQMFVDNVQEQYNLFSSNMKESYRFWQSQSCAEVVRKREARNKAIFKGVVGALLIAGAAAAASDNSYSGEAAAVAAGVAGAVLLTESWQDSKEAKVHSEVINELASTIDGQLAPQIIEIEDQTVTLTGDSATTDKPMALDTGKNLGSRVFVGSSSCIVRPPRRTPFSERPNLGTYAGFQSGQISGEKKVFHPYCCWNVWHTAACVVDYYTQHFP